MRGVCTWLRVVYDIDRQFRKTKIKKNTNRDTICGYSVFVERCRIKLKLKRKSNLLLLNTLAAQNIDSTVEIVLYIISPLSTNFYELYTSISIRKRTV